MKKPLILSTVVVTGLAALVVLLMTLPNGTNNTAQQKVITPEKTVPPADVMAPGRYADYTDALLAEEGFATNVLFFHAPWCPECRAFEQAIINSDLPDGLQILKVDFDSAAALREKYGVTVQPTFVSVDSAGTKLSQWIGDSKDVSLDAIIRHL